MRQGSRALGIFLVLGSAVLWSTAGLFIRMADLDIWSIVGWRSGFTAVVLGAFVGIRARVAPGGAPRSFGLPGLIATLLAVIASISYIAALSWTTVANVMTIYAALPFIATAIAYVWLRERTNLRFMIAGLVALAGICVMVGAAFAPRDLLGIGAALAMTTGFAAVLVFARRFPAVDLTVMTFWSTVLCTVIALPFMSHSLPAPQQLLACALYGVLSTGISYIMVLMGGRMIGAGEAGFLSMLDVVLGPLWVWLFFNEAVGLTTFIGGAIVLLSVIWYLGGGNGGKAQLADAMAG